MNKAKWVSTNTLNEHELKYKGQQVNQYDKVVKENLEAALPGLIRNILRIDIADSEEIPDDIQHTKERRPDLLKKVTDKSGKTYILHIEFQVQNVTEMPYRMLEYRSMLLRNYRLPVKQVVFLIGALESTMITTIQQVNLSFSYEIITLSELDYNLFLSSSEPGEQVLAILANFNQDSRKDALSKIVQRVQESCDGEFAQNRHFKHLLILAQLRNFEIHIKSIIMQSVESFFKIERDPLYLIGEEKGEARGETKGKQENQNQVIKNMIQKLGLNDEQIVVATEATVDHVRKIRASLNQ